MLSFLTSKSSVLAPHVTEVVLLKSVAEQEGDNSGVKVTARVVNCLS